MPAGTDLDTLVAAVTAYVDPHAIPDYAVTGLQVRGADRVTKLAIGESANVDLFERAAAWGAEAVLVHHGLYWFSEDPDNDPAKPFDDARAAVLRRHGMSLLAYHLPLDAHPEVGNNTAIARRLGLEVASRDFAVLPDSEVAIGLVARAEPPLSPEELLARCEALFGQPPVAVMAGSERIGSVAIVSGGGTSELYAAIRRGVDSYITGEGREWATSVAREAGIHLVAVGHHASEVFGVQDLGDWIAARFGVETRFFPQANPY